MTKVLISHQKKCAKGLVPMELSGLIYALQQRKVSGLIE